MKGRGAQALRCYEIATGAYRAPDPWYAVADDVIVRRLSPNNRKLDAESHPLELTSTEFNLLEVLARNAGRLVSAVSSA